MIKYNIYDMQTGAIIGSLVALNVADAERKACALYDMGSESLYALTAEEDKRSTMNTDMARLYLLDRLDVLDREAQFYPESVTEIFSEMELIEKILGIYSEEESVL